MDLFLHRAGSFEQTRLTYGTDLGIDVGARKYLKPDDFATFAGGSIFYSTTKDGNQKDMSIMGEFGAEYFLHRQFSVEGSVGFGYTSSETETTTGAVTTNFRTRPSEPNELL